MAKDTPTTEKVLPKISKHMYMADVVQRFPETADVFIQSGLHCFGCSVAMFETVEQGAMAHGLDSDQLVKNLNAAVSSSNKTKK
jgi:hybrid cluster-associated redox disulfide protein